MSERDDGRRMLPELPGLGDESDAQALQRHRVSLSGGRRPPRVRRLYFRTVARVMSKRPYCASIQREEQSDHAQADAEGRHRALLEGLAHRTARGVQPRLAPPFRCLGAAAAAPRSTRLSPNWP